MRTLFIAVVLLFSHCLMAQNVTIDKGCPAAADLDDGITTRFYAGADETHLYTFVFKPAFSLNPREFFVRAYRLADGAVVYNKKVELNTKEKLITVVGATYINGSFKVLWQELSRKNKVNTLFKAEIDPNNIPNPVQPVFVGEKKEPDINESYDYKLVKSGNQKTNLVYSFLRNANGPMPAYFFMLDSAFNLVKKQEHLLPALGEYAWVEKVAVSNNGNACVLFRYEDKQAGWPYKYKYFSYDNASGTFANKEVTVENAEIMGLTCDFNPENDLVLAGNYSNKLRKDFNKKYAKNLGGFFYYKVDALGTRMIKQLRQSFKSDLLEMIISDEGIFMQNPGVRVYFDKLGATYYVYEHDL